MSHETVHMMSNVAYAKQLLTEQSTVHIPGTNAEARPLDANVEPNAEVATQPTEEQTSCILDT